MGPSRPRATPPHQLDLLGLLFLLWPAVNQLFRASRRVGQQDVDLSEASRGQAVARSIYLQAPEFHFPFVDREEVESGLASFCFYKRNN